MKELTQCPDCGIMLEKGKGPHSLAWHGCIPGRKDGEVDVDGRDLLETLANKADLTAEEAATGLMRGVLLQMVEDPTRVPAKAVGEIVSGAAKLCSVGGDGTTDTLLRQWIKNE